MNRFLSSTRFMILLAVFGALIAATTILVYGFAEALQLAIATVRHGELSTEIAKELTLEFIEIVDLFLLGTVFLIISVGLYELFIGGDLQLPEWLEIRTLDDLKHKLIGVVVVVLGVLFLGQVVGWDGERDLLGFGAAIALVIGALTYFLGQQTSAKTKRDAPESPPENRR